MADEPKVETEIVTAKPDPWAVLDRFTAACKKLHTAADEVRSVLAKSESSQFSMPAITDEWVTAYCKATNRDPRGTWNTMADDGWVSITFFEAAKRELQLALQTCHAQVSSPEPKA